MGDHFISDRRVINQGKNGQLSSTGTVHKLKKPCPNRGHRKLLCVLEI